VSNYVQSTNFATKDALTSGDPLKIVKGTEINTEFVNIAVAVATKADLASPTFTGTPLAPTASFSTSTTQLATTAFVQAAMAALHPVGSIYINATDATNPGTLLGFGTWTAFGAGRVPVGFDAGNVLFDTAEETGGAANATLPTHTHTLTDPGHLHTTTGVVNGTVPAGVSTVGVEPAVSNTTYNTGSAFTGITVDSAGASATNANYQPYITVFMWKRTV
jgi:microcystin-dependent protein